MLHSEASRLMALKKGLSRASYVSEELSACHLLGRLAKKTCAECECAIAAIGHNMCCVALTFPLRCAGGAGAVKRALEAEAIDIAHVAEDARHNLHHKAALLAKTAGADAAAAIKAEAVHAERQIRALESAVAAGSTDAAVAVDQVTDAVRAALRHMQEVKAATKLDALTTTAAGARPARADLQRQLL